MNIINKFMDRKKINDNLQMRIRAYLQFLWREEFIQNSEKEETIINKLSNSLREELLHGAHGKILDKFPMFFGNFSEGFLRKLLFKIREIRMTPEETIFLVSFRIIILNKNYI